MTNGAHHPFPPFFRDLAEQVAPGDCGDPEPAGSLAEYRHTSRVSAETIWRCSYSCDQPERRYAADSVRAWFVPILVEQVVEAPNSDLLAAAIYRWLRSAMPEVDWRPVDYSHKVLGLTPDFVTAKYGFLHTLVPTPPDEATGAPMALELYGPVVSIDGVAPRSGQAWLHSSPAARLREHKTPFIDQPFSIRVDKAIWANVAWTHVGVPFYM